jgi:hypothetical protein
MLFQNGFAIGEGKDGVTPCRQGVQKSEADQPIAMSFVVGEAFGGVFHEDGQRFHRLI